MNASVIRRIRGEHMEIMTVLKVIFVLLLCVPLAYLIIYFFSRLMDEVIKQSRVQRHEAEKRSRRHRR